MDRELFIRAVSRFFAGLLIVGLLLFLPAGTLRYPQAWILIGILFIPMFTAGLIMMKKNPELLKKRLNVREKETEQREVILFSGLMFLAAFILAGFSFRFGWLMLPFPVSIIAAINDNTHLCFFLILMDHSSSFYRNLYTALIMTVNACFQYSHAQEQIPFLQVHPQV